jgi:hypothetical protein
MPDITEYMKKFGPWAVLFVILLTYVLTDAKARESKYQEMLLKNQDIIQKMTNMYEIKLVAIDEKLEALKK